MTTKRVLVLENYDGTPVGQVGRALAEASAEVETRRLFRGEPVPEGPNGFDGLVILGGGQSAVDDAAHPYLPRVAELARLSGEAGKAVLGVCLGAQLVARGHGATNILGRPLEFGWAEVQPTAAGSGDPVLKSVDGGAPVFHWHTDTFTLPDGAVHLAASAMTELQAFRIGRAVYGIQFHFEADRALVERWNGHFAGEIARDIPDWPARHAAEAALHGPGADATGLAMARRWVALV